MGAPMENICRDGVSYRSVVVLSVGLVKSQRSYVIEAQSTTRLRSVSREANIRFRFILKQKYSSVSGVLCCSNELFLDLGMVSLSLSIR